ncbi:hypothetical protein [Mesoterricola silvestris]|uniref:Uncharacterized protein n=1 Tax=Mesoterricola silvestris TaxID=2927979 RepID=A0AA48GN86_9BACT|nr:hypothetical protein [Mesoterricola silvestris]BDU72640.1 hypothetical protein METEAL_18140 [Mesoterricola silvestris]
MTWPLPPHLPWPQFLRRLRHPAPPPGWLEAAADLEEVRRRPVLLRWIAQHPRLGAHLRGRLLPTLPWRALASIAQDAAAHPQARQHATERLLALWPGLTPGERRSLAMAAPRQLWPSIWKTRDPRVLEAFLQHPRLGVEALAAMVQPPLDPAQAEALQASRWLEVVPVAHQVLVALDRGLEIPGSGLVLGMASPWIKALPEEERLLAATRLVHPTLRRMVRAWAAPRLPED